MNEESKKLTDEEVKAGLSAIFGGILGEARNKATRSDLYIKVRQEPKLLEDYESFNYKVGLLDILSAVDYAVRDMSGIENQMDQFYFASIFQDTHYYEAHIEKLLTQTTGFGCTADCSRTIITRFLKTMRGQELQTEWNAKNYWVPSYGTQEQWFELVRGLAHFKHGKPDQYLKALSALQVAFGWYSAEQGESE